MVITDHKANLNVTVTSKQLNFKKLCRWVSELLEFPGVTWKHVPGTANGLPDFLSRLQEEMKDYLVSSDFGNFDATTVLGGQEKPHDPHAV